MPHINTYSGSRLRRRNEILALVREGAVHSQEELQRQLRRRGMEVAQPTLSRDLKALGLAKSAAGYVAPPARVFVPAEARHAALDRALREFTLEVRAAASLVVLRTPPAGAHPLARALDEADLDEMVGTIAGDDTVFVATPGPSAALRLERRFRAALTPRRAPA
jgi:transcriptional regulator of arginine metabolism